MLTETNQSRPRQTHKRSTESTRRSYSTWCICTGSPIIEKCSPLAFGLLRDSRPRLHTRILGTDVKICTATEHDREVHRLRTPNTDIQVNLQCLVDLLTSAPIWAPVIALLILPPGGAVLHYSIWQDEVALHPHSFHRFLLLTYYGMALWDYCSWDCSRGTWVKTCHSGKENSHQA